MIEAGNFFILHLLLLLTMLLQTLCNYWPLKNGQVFLVMKIIIICITKESKFVTAANFVLYFYWKFSNNYWICLWSSNSCKTEIHKFGSFKSCQFLQSGSPDDFWNFRGDEMFALSLTIFKEINVLYERYIQSCYIFHIGKILEALFLIVAFKHDAGGKLISQ